MLSTIKLLKINSYDNNFKNLQNHKQTSKKTDILSTKKLWDISKKKTNYIET